MKWEQWEMFNYGSSFMSCHDLLCVLGDAKLNPLDCKWLKPGGGGGGGILDLCCELLLFICCCCKTSSFINSDNPLWLSLIGSKPVKLSQNFSKKKTFRT